MAQATTLYEYYKSIGKSLPSWQDRKAIYEKAGLGSADSYTGSGSQNNKLLSSLQSKSSSSSTAGQWVNQITGETKSSMNKPGQGWVTKTIYDATHKAKVKSAKTSTKEDKQQTKQKTPQQIAKEVETAKQQALKIQQDIRDKQAIKDAAKVDEVDEVDEVDGKDEKGFDFDGFFNELAGYLGRPLNQTEKDSIRSDIEQKGVSAANTWREEYQDTEDDGAGDGDTVLDNKWAKMLEGDTAQIYVQYKNMLKDGSVEEQKAWVDALDQAGKDSDAYFAEKLNIFKDEFRDALGTLNADLEAREAELSLRSQRLKDNLENQKGDLSVEQNAELARKQIDYTNVLKDTRSSMASRGLSSSSIRNQAEEKLNVAQEDIIESTNRRYSRATRDAALVESRGLEDITAAQTELARKAEEAKTSGVKEAEQTWGTGRLEGLGSLGGLDFSKYTSGLVSQGTAKEAQASDIKSRVNTTLTAQFY